MAKKNNNKPKMEPVKPKISFSVVYFAMILFLGYLMFQDGGFFSKEKELTFTEFEQKIETGDIEAIVANESTRSAAIYLSEKALEKEVYKDVKNTKGAQFSVKFGNIEVFQNKLDAALKVGKIKEYKFESPSEWMGILGNLLPILFLVGITLYFMRRMSGASGGGGMGGQVFNIGKSKAKLFDKDQKTKTTFKDVAGQEEAKEEVKEIVDFLKNPDKYTKLGGKIPKGALLIGPPGTGKTLLAKAVAGEADVPFFSLSGSDFVEMFVGVGASRVRDLFKQAKQKSPSIIFIDEIDTIGKARGKGGAPGSNDERENTLNQLLSEMDGFGSDANVIVMAATNRADVLDKALLRPGRFDRQIFVDLPDKNERKAIFEVHIKPLKMDDTVDIDFLARQTPGFSGADIANVCNEAALIAARKGKDAITKQDFLDAVDRIIGGMEKKNKIVTPLEKKTIAYHESGHATASWLLEHAAPLVKVTIVPRGQSLGAAWYLPEERMIVKASQMKDEMCATLAGRAAEEVIFNEISTGALNDLEKVTKQARAMVTYYGLNKTIGNITYYDSSGQEYGFTKPYSEETAITIDKEISILIEEQYQRAVKILRDNKDKLTALAEQLLLKEVIFKEDLEKIFGKRTFQKYIIEEEVVEENKKNEDAKTSDSE